MILLFWKFKQGGEYMKKYIILLLTLVFLLIGCSAKVNTRPDDIREEIWDNGIKYGRLINYYVDNKEIIPDGFAERIALYCDVRNYKNLNDSEKEILTTTSNLTINSLKTVFFGEEIPQEYKQNLKDLESFYGEGTLDSSNVTEKDLSNNIVNSLLAKEESKNKVIDDYMKENNITLTAKDVQYDIKNNLDKNFAIVGTAELDNYYNYGFDERMEKDYFVAFVIPEGSSYSDGWYLYFHRDSFDKLFRELKNGNRNIMATCQIPKWRYEDGQNNMAIVESLSW